MKNASDGKKNHIPSIDGTSNFSYSMVSMETPTMRVDAESAAAATVLLQADDSLEKGGSKQGCQFKFVLFNNNIIMQMSDSDFVLMYIARAHIKYASCQK